ncbi:hypothetical protein N665_0385s0046 [Sinapis alba]|nr:hypothetical protein N665_0385s0046 [Sinapis alba]
MKNLISLLKNVHSRQYQVNWYVQVRFLQQDSLSKPKKYKYPLVYDPYGPRPQPSSKIMELAERIAALSPQERKQISPALNEHMSLPKQQMISTQGMSMGAKQEAGTGKTEEKKEKTSFDVKLEKFDTAAKIKVIKEVRAFTSLSLKEAKELVEKVPVVIKQGLTKEEANGIIEKIKAVGGVAVME